MSDELPFDGSAVDTERLGQAIHRVLTRLIAQARGTHAGDWQRPERIPTSVIDDELPDSCNRVLDSRKTPTG